MGAECCKSVDGPVPAPLDNPPRSGLGRDRQAPAPRESTGQELSAYVEQAKGAQLVYRCAKCDVRLANEADVCRQGSVKREVFAVTFTQTYNLFVSDGSVCCVRCGEQLCEYDEADHRLLTLPLFHEDGTPTMKKSLLRALCLVNLTDVEVSCAGTPSLRELQQLLPHALPDDHGDKGATEPLDATFWVAGCSPESSLLAGTRFQPKPDAVGAFDAVLAVNVLGSAQLVQFAWACSGGNVLCAGGATTADGVEALRRDGHLVDLGTWSGSAAPQEAAAVDVSDTLAEAETPPLPPPPALRAPPAALRLAVTKTIRGKLLYPRWLPEPPASATPAPHDGRERALWSGDVGDEDGAESYLTAVDGQLQVYRCRACGCRVANEAEICRAPSWARKLFGATFTRTFNFKVVDMDVCCVRCGEALFPSDARDSALLTVPLYWDGQRTLDKSPLRVVLFANPWNDMLFVHPDGERQPPSRKIAQRLGTLATAVQQAVPVGWALEATFLVRVFRAFVEVPKYVVLNTRARLDKYGFFKEVVQEWRDAGVGPTYQFVPDFEEETTLAALPAQDVGVYVRVQFDNSMYCSWTDYGGLDWESSLLGMWTTCGGNLVFADWFTPKGTRYQARHNVKNLAVAAENHEWWYNRQPSYAQLMRDNHYLGWWSAKQDPPPFVLGRVRRAALYRQVYPQWLFVRDFPSPLFDSLVRQRHDRRRDGRIDEELFKKSPPYAARARDTVSPAGLQHI